jgi:hypothetical protein
MDPEPGNSSQLSRKSSRLKAFQCDECTRSFSSTHGLRQHKDAKHTISSSSPRRSHSPPTPPPPPTLSSPRSPQHTPSGSESPPTTPQTRTPSHRSYSPPIPPPSPSTSSSHGSPHTPSGSPLASPRSLLLSPQKRGMERDPGVQVITERHPLLDGAPCDIEGFDIPPGALPAPIDERRPDDYSPFNNRAEFEFAEFLYAKDEMSAAKINQLMDILARLYPDQDPPFANHKELYSIIDQISHGDVPWDSFSVSYNGQIPDSEPPPWMTQKYEVWFRSPLHVMENQIGNPDFQEKFDYAPKRVFRQNKRQYTDLMSGNWAWTQAVCYLTLNSMCLY